MAKRNPTSRATRTSRVACVGLRFAKRPAVPGRVAADRAGHVRAEPGGERNDAPVACEGGLGGRRDRGGRPRADPGRHRLPLRGGHRAREPRGGARPASAAASRRVRLANLMQLAHPMSVDLHVESVVANAKLVVARVLGGRRLLVLRGRAARRDVPRRVDSRSPSFRATTSRTPSSRRSARFRRKAPIGSGNTACTAGPRTRVASSPSRPTSSATRPSGGNRRRSPGPGSITRSAGRADSTRWPPGGSRAPPPRPSCSTAPTSRRRTSRPSTPWCTPSARARVNALPIYVSSLKDPVSADVVSRACSRMRGVRLVLNATGFAVSTPGATGTAPVALRRERPPGAPGGARGRARGGLGERHAGALRARHRDERRAPRGGRAHPRPRRVVQGGGEVRRAHRVPDRRLRPAARPGRVHRRPRAGVDRPRRDPGRPSGGSASCSRTTRTGTAGSATGSGSTPRRGRWSCSECDGGRGVPTSTALPRERQRPRRRDRGRGQPTRGSRGA